MAFYSSEQAVQLNNRIGKLRTATVQVQLALHDLSLRISNAHARHFVNEGIGRRLPIVARSAQNIFKLYPPDKSDLLSRDECEDISIQIHAFAINCYAIFDNIAWACMLEDGGNLHQTKVGLLQKECRKYIPPLLKSYVSSDTTRAWFNKYGKIYRDSTAHRIPPYLPHRAYTHEDSEDFREMHSLSEQLLIDAHKALRQNRKRGLDLLSEHKCFFEEKQNIGSNSPVMALASNNDDSGPSILLHPQLLSDWAMSNELVSTFEHAMRSKYGFPSVDFSSVEML